MAIVAADTPSAEPARQTGMQRRQQRTSHPQMFLAYSKEDKVIFGAFVMESCFHVRMDWNLTFLGSGYTALLHPLAVTKEMYC